MEDDAEKTTIRYLEYRNERDAMEKKANGKLTMLERGKLAKLAEQKGSTDKILKRCLQSEDVIGYWKVLTEAGVGGRFIMTKHFASKWTDKVVHQPGGGVSKNWFVFYCILTFGISFSWRWSKKLRVRATADDLVEI